MLLPVLKLYSLNPYEMEKLKRSFNLTYKALLASDFAIVQFSTLECLLLVHSHWYYRSLSMMIDFFFFYKTFHLDLPYFGLRHMLLSLVKLLTMIGTFYNVFFTSLPLIALGIYNQDVSANLCLKS